MPRRVLKNQRTVGEIRIWGGKNLANRKTIEIRKNHDFSLKYERI